MPTLPCVWLTWSLANQLCATAFVGNTHETIALIARFFSLAFFLSVQRGRLKSRVEPQKGD
jgi:hypothetical protein